MTIFVVPDSNNLYSDLFLEYPPLSAILSAEATADVRLLLPAVVVDEMRHHLEERLGGLVEVAKKHRRDLARLDGGQTSSISFQITPDVERSILDRFDNRMQQFATEGRVLAYPTIPPNELALRSIRTQRPFIGKDRGLRDTFIWLCIRDHLSAIQGTGSIVILVTKDEAFYEEKSKADLSEELTKEIEDAGLPRNSVLVERELQTVIDKHISKMLSDAHWIREQIEGGAIAGFASGDSLVLDAANDWFIDHGEMLQSLSQRYPIYGFNRLTYVHRLSVERTLVLGDGKVSVTSDWRGNLPIIVGDPGAAIQFGDFLYQGAPVKFTVSSLLECEGERCSVQSHEIIRMDIGMY